MTLQQFKTIQESAQNHHDSNSILPNLHVSNFDHTN